MDLSKEQSEKYIDLVKKGNMDNVFDYGYTLGKEHALAEIVEIIKTTDFYDLHKQALLKIKQDQINDFLNSNSV